MKQLFAGMIRLLGVLFAILVLGFTGYQSWSLLYDVSDSAMVATLGLILFEGGMIYWWAVFLRDAEGILQMALSLLLAITSLVLVGLAVALHLGAVDVSMMGPNTPAKLISLAALAHLTGKFLYPIFAPATYENILARALEGVVAVRSFSKAEQTVERTSAQMAAIIGNEVARRVQVRMLTQYGLESLVEQIQPVIIDAEAVDGDGGDAPRRSLIDRLLARAPQPAAQTLQSAAPPPPVPRPAAPTSAAEESAQDASPNA